MNDYHDIEKRLKEFKHQPDPGIRRSVLDRFAQTVGLAGSNRYSDPFWARPIPLYLAAAVLCVAVGLSFLAGRQLTLADAPADTFRSGGLDTTTTLPEEVLWQTAPSDIL
jgi:hypothetical protein